MTYYDHATAITLKLDRWREESIPRNFELEALACEQRQSAEFVKKQSLVWRCVSILRSHNLCEARQIRARW